VVDELGADERTLHLTTAAASADDPAGHRVLVLVDQCEELFTLCRDRGERAAFLRNLHYAAMVPGGRTTVVLTLRADFYVRLVQFPAIAQLVQSHQMLVGGMDEHQLRQVIEEPARAAGLDVEPGLVETIVADAVREPGTLPLLEHALLETWKRRHGGTLTLQGYRATGGVRRGLSDRAEVLYTELGPECQDLARDLLLRLTQPGEGTEDTRRRALLQEVTSGPDSAMVTDVVHRFVDARLVTTSADETTGERWVEVSHEALIRGWPRLQGWIDADRAGLLVHRRLTAAAQEWQRLGRDEGVLYRGASLTEALEWGDQMRGRLNPLESEFLAASAESARVAQRARRRRVQLAFVALVTALSVIGTIALVAVGQRREAEHQRDVARSGQLAANAGDALAVDPALGLSLALRAIDTAQTPQAADMVRRATAEARGTALLADGKKAVLGVRILPDGTRAVAAGSDGTVRVWDLVAHTPIARLQVHNGAIFTIRAAPNGQTVATSSADGTAAVTDLVTGRTRVVVRAEPGETVPGLAFSPDGGLLAASTSGGAVHVVDAATGVERFAVRPATVAAKAVAFSPDGRLLAVALRNGSVPVVEVSDSRLRTTLPGQGSGLEGVEFDPADGGRLLTAGDDGIVRLWTVDGDHPDATYPVSGRTVFTASFAPGGDRFVASGADGRVRVWDLDGVELAVLRGHVHYVFDASFDETGAVVYSAGQDGTVRSWAIAPDAALRAPVTGVDLSPDGQRILASGADGHLRIWSTRDRRLQLDVPDHTGRFWAYFSANDQRIVSYGEDGYVRVRDATGDRELASLQPAQDVVWAADVDPGGTSVVSTGNDGAVVVHSLVGAPTRILKGHDGPVFAVQFSPDGASIVSGGADGTVRLWGPDGHDRVFTGIEGRVGEVTFSRDGRRIAATGFDGSVHVWDVDGTAVAVLRGHEGTANSVRFVGDGGRLVTAGADGTVRVWDVGTSSLLRTLSLYTRQAVSVDADADATVVVSASEDEGLVRLSTCEVCGPLDEVLAMARSRVIRPPTPEEERRFGT
jgi:WD40 repeat protein